MDEELVGEVGMVAIEQQVIERRRRVACPPLHAAQRDGLQPHRRGLAWRRAARSDRDRDRRQRQQPVARVQPPDGQERVLRPRRRRVDRLPPLGRGEGVLGGDEEGAAVERVEPAAAEGGRSTPTTRLALPPRPRTRSPVSTSSIGFEVPSAMATRVPVTRQLVGHCPL